MSTIGAFNLAARTASSGSARIVARRISPSHSAWARSVSTISSSVLGSGSSTPDDAPKRSGGRGHSSSSSSSNVKRNVTTQTQQSPGVTRPRRVISCSRIFSSMAATASPPSTAPLEAANGAVDGSSSSTEKQPSVNGSEDIRIPSDLVTMEELRTIASRKTTPLSLSNMYRYASGGDNSQRLRNAQFLHRELPIRIAQRAIDLLTLPHGLNNTTQVRSIAHIYLRYLQKFREIPCPTTPEEEEQFTDMLQSLVLDRTSIPTAIAKAVASLRDNRREELDVRRIQEMEEALYRFFTARVGLRFLTEHHILSSPGRKNKNEELRRLQSCIHLGEGDNSSAGCSDGVESDGVSTDEDFLGCIQKNCDPVKEVRRVAGQVARQTRECYGICPDIEIVDCTSDRDSKRDFTYVPTHLQYMLAELLKNSCRATVRRHLAGDILQEDYATSHCQHGFSNKANDASTLPPVRVIVVKGAEDVTIKIADKGGGVPRSSMRDIWKFAHSSNHTIHSEIESKELKSTFGTDDFTGGNIRGFGLPLARIYARYFGGELTLKSMEGYGVDAYLHLPVLGVACENLPPRVANSPGNLDSSAPDRSKGKTEEMSDNFKAKVDTGAPAANVDESNSGYYTHQYDLYGEIVSRPHVILNQLARKAL